MKIEYEDLVRVLFERFPELDKIYHSQVEGERDLPHLVFGDVVAEHIRLLLREGTDDTLVCRLFAFLEELSTQEDPRIHNLVQISVYEEFLGEPDIREKARACMGAATLQLANHLEDHLAELADDSGVRVEGHRNDPDDS